MLNTYLNDNQSMAYPFYGGGSLPFPMCVITGLSLCILVDDTAEPASTNILYADSVTISSDSVTVVICRKADLTTTEVVGVLTATMQGSCNYIPSYVDASVYSESDGIQTLYEELAARDNVVFRTTTSTGFMQLGSIPESAVGSYKGPFYIDPSCAIYMKDSVFGKHKKYQIGLDSSDIGQSFIINTSGLLTWTKNNSADANSYTIDNKFDTDSQELVVLDAATRRSVTDLCGYRIESVGEADAYPILTLVGEPEALIKFDISGAPTAGTVIDGGTACPDTPVIITITGTTGFPNCDKD